MVAHEEREGRSATREEEDDAAEVAAPSKLKLVGHYAMLGFAPVVAVVALVVAIMAMSGSQSGEEQANKAIAATENLDKSMEAAKSELERLRLAMAQDKNGKEDERRQQDALAAKIIQNITQLQAKLKVSPTLEQQLQPPASAPAASPAAAEGAAAPVGAKGTTDKKLGAQMNAIKEAIEQFNKQ